MSWNDAEMHGDARPCDALHKGHRRGGVDIRSVIPLAADDSENSLRRWVARDPRRYRRAGDEPLVVVYGDTLVGDRRN